MKTGLLTFLVYIANANNYQYHYIDFGLIMQVTSGGVDSQENSVTPAFAVDDFAGGYHTALMRQCLRANDRVPIDCLATGAALSIRRWGPCNPPSPSA